MGIFRAFIWLVLSYGIATTLLFVRLHGKDGILALSSSASGRLAVLLLNDDTINRKRIRDAPSSSTSKALTCYGTSEQLIPNNSTAGGYSAVPSKSVGTFYVMNFGRRINDFIEKVLDARPGYRSIAVAKEASIVWTKMVDDDPVLRLALGRGSLSYSEVQPWQRINHVRNKQSLNDKDMFLARIHEYANRNLQSSGDRIREAWFLPESYRLHVKAEKEAFLHRVDYENGINEAWVCKDPTVDRGEGVAMLGPGSDRLKELRMKLTDEFLPVSALSWYNRTADPSAEVSDASSKQFDKRLRNRLIVQKYIPTLQWQGHKFDLRVYWLVASVSPLLVYYHDGIARVSLTSYNPTDFADERIKSHLTNVAQSLSGGNETDRLLNLATRSFDDLDLILRKFVASDTKRSSHFESHIKDDPLGYVRQRIKDALTFVVDAFRETALNPDGCPADNCYVFFGADFMLDENLNVWMTEVQYGPNLAVKAKAKEHVFKKLVPEMFAIVDEVREKQVKSAEVAAPLLPLASAKTWELFYC